MSTLTKILIVLLTISSIFLCGIVVTYVASAKNHKEAFDNRKNQIDRLQESERATEAKFNETVKLSQEREIELKKTIAALEGQINQLNTELAGAKSSRDDALQRINNWASITEDFQKTYDEQGQMLKKALADVVTLSAEQDQNQKELQEKALALLENMALINQLEKDSRRLREENTALQNKLDQFMRQYGKTIPTTSPVTQIADKARVAPPVPDIDLKGTISAVNIKDAWAEISIGSANGVKKKMTFHATRGDRFICDIVIFEVDPDKAIGKLELVQETPKEGDIVSTNL